ncbi:MAG: NAD(P)-binding domain-containing protein [Comamonadaceae bacterium]|nr:NAD(P)-binding domain-containing protein [Comamonadaceae bacterium]
MGRRDGAAPAARRGHQLAVYARRPAAVLTLSSQAGRRGAAPRRGTGRAPARSCSPWSPAARTWRSLLSVADGVIARRPAPGSPCLVDTSTIAPSCARAHRVAARRAAGIAMLDAPVSGGPSRARQEASLAIMVGGDAGGAGAGAAAARGAWARTIVHVGPERRRAGGQGLQPDGHGGRRSRPARRRCICARAARRRSVPACVRRCAGGSAGSRVLDVFGERMARRDFAAGIEARLHHKDFGLLLREACGSGRSSAADGAGGAAALCPDGSGLGQGRHVEPAALAGGRQADSRFAGADLSFVPRPTCLPACRRWSGDETMPPYQSCI